MNRGVLVLVLVASACASLATRPPRFVVVYEQRTRACLIQVIEDQESAACFVAFRCGRQPWQVLNAPTTVCER